MQRYGSSALAKRDDDYSVLDRATGSGEMIGSFRDHPIYERVIDEFGRVYAYLGVAPRRRDGSFDVDALGPGEFVVPPGLLYLCEETRAKSKVPRSSQQISLI
jgi:hypothetical protein